MNAFLSLDIYYLALFFVLVYAGSFGLPTGVILIIVSFASASEGWRDVLLIFFLSYSASVAGDYSAFLLSGRFRKNFERLIERFAWTRNKKRVVEKTYDRYGVYAVFLTRFILSGIGPYINYLSGLEAMPKRKFLRAIISGEFIYCSFLILVGYFFSGTWLYLVKVFENYTAFAVLSLLGLYVVFRLAKLIQKTGSLENPEKDPEKI